MPRPLCLALILLTILGNSPAEDPRAASNVQIPLQYRVVCIPASLHDQLREDLGLDRKKYLVCDYQPLNALLEAVQGHQEGQIVVVPPVRASLNHPTTTVVNGFRLTVTPRISETIGNPVNLDLRVVEPQKGPAAVASPRTAKEGLLPNSIERNTTLTPGKTVLLPGWWQEGKPGQEAQRVIICVTMPGGR